jgi:hypothetical protein
MWKYSLAIRRISLAIKNYVYTRRPTGLKKIQVVKEEEKIGYKRVQVGFEEVQLDNEEVQLDYVETQAT